jgi:hypothetical protein
VAQAGLDPADGSMGQREYARSRGLPVATVAKAVKSGRIDRLANGRIDPRAADATWAGRTRSRVDGRVPRAPDASEAAAPAAPKNRVSTEVNTPVNGHARGRAASSPPRGSVAEAQRTVLLLRAKREQMELQERAGTLIDAEEARSVAFAVGRRARDMLVNLPARLGPSLEMRDAASIEKLLTAELQRVCEELSRWAKL